PGPRRPPLNARGREQARALARSLVGEQLAAIYSSDRRRPSETAEIVAQTLRTTYEARRDLREIDVGEWSSLTIEGGETPYRDERARPRGRAEDRGGASGLVFPDRRTRRNDPRPAGGGGRHATRRLPPHEP